MRIQALTIGLVMLVVSSSWGQTLYSFRKTLEQVRQSNPTLRLQNLDVAATQSDEITAGLKSNPFLNNQTLFQLSPRHLPNDGTFLSRQNRQFWLQLTKEFDIYGKRSRRVSLAQGLTQLSANNVKETSRNVLRDAALLWLDAWYASTKVTLLEQTQINLDSLVYLNRVRLRNQVVSTTDLTRTEVLSTQNALQLRTARQLYRNELSELTIQMGQPDSIQLDINDPVLSPFSVDSLLTYSQNQRSDVLAARSGLEAANRNRELQQVLAKPANEMGAIWNPQNAIPYAGVFLTFELPVFSRNQGEIQKSKILQQQAQDQLTFLQKRISVELRNALTSFQNHQRTLQQYEQLLLQSDKVLASVRYAYLKGATTLVDYLEAQRTWYDTRQTYYDALFEYRKSFVDVLYSSGLISQW
ncbi:TolC family protein [Siphonobacter sp. SORGH_AS_1065]|uniref:TolC family protein n=1 Tax=Siphonobacter sp. SORGH_AS_1065 TaxID=3041795 RepID=UPI00277E8431|nr:TolC family protein [Siphonobacter sp. SORGH_AS_1065]MDQ1086722.1 cobalt-zinc-cadmium efflux system outer membrane protein [Siphonobacter sp. SORGH_AS_1065]